MRRRNEDKRLKVVKTRQEAGHRRLDWSACTGYCRLSCCKWLISRIFSKLQSANRGANFMNTSEIEQGGSVVQGCAGMFYRRAGNPMDIMKPFLAFRGHDDERPSGIANLNCGHNRLESSGFVFMQPLDLGNAILNKMRPVQVWLTGQFDHHHQNINPMSDADSLFGRKKRRRIGSCIAAGNAV